MNIGKSKFEIAGCGSSSWVMTRCSALKALDKTAQGNALGLRWQRFIKP